ncbi:MAG: preprotein translocase subunit SecG [Solitalea-like symbiont of Acarus siro]
MYTFLIVLGIIVEILLIVIVFVQNPKSDSTGAMTGGGSSQILGAGQTSDFFEKTTWTLIVALFVIALLSGIFLNTNHSRSLLEQRIQEQGSSNPIKQLDGALNRDTSSNN